MVTRAELAQIHILKKDLHLTDEIYRDILFVETGEETARNLSHEQALRVLAHLRSIQGGRPMAENEASPSQIRLIERLWACGEGIRDRSISALAHFLRRRFHIRDLRHIPRRKVGAVITALRHMARNTVPGPPPANDMF